MLAQVTAEKIIDEDGRTRWQIQWPKVRPVIDPATGKTIKFNEPYAAEVFCLGFNAALRHAALEDAGAAANTEAG